MSNLFNLDSPFFRFLASVFDYMVLNILALLLSLPVFTAGASLTALYRVVLEGLQERKDLSPKAFWSCWKASLRSATLPWLLFLALAILFLGDLRIIGFMPEGARTIMAGGVILLFLLLLCVSLFYFPLLAANPGRKFRQLLRASFIRSIGLLPRTVCMAALWLLPGLLFLFLPRLFIALTFVWVLIWFSAAANLSSRLIRRYLALEEPEK